MGHAALARARVLPHLRGAVDRGAARARPASSPGGAQKRYDDTQILISAFCEHGYDSDLGRRAIRRMNRIHGRFEIANDDFLYVLSTMVFEPIRWNARFGWRPLIEIEKLATFHFWREVGRRMAIRDLPERLRRVRAVQRRVRTRALRVHGRRAPHRRRHARHVPAGSPACRQSAVPSCTRCSTSRCSTRSASRVRHLDRGAPSRLRSAHAGESSAGCRRAADRGFGHSNATARTRTATNSSASDRTKVVKQVYCYGAQV